jgi:hypothetical protein
LFHYLFPILFVLSSCAFFKPAPPITSDHANELPDWAYAPMDACSEASEICASGEGKTNSIADANAKKSLASIFETKIEAQTSSHLSASGSAILMKAQESATVSVTETVNQTLEATQVIKRFRFKEMSYSLVSLDKAKASENLRARIDKIQSELSALWKRRDRTAWSRMWELAHQREALNDRFNIMMGERIQFTPNISELQAWYQSRRAEIPLAYEFIDLPKEYASQIVSRLTNSGYRLFEMNQGSRIKAVLESKKEHMNVKGFEKWFFNLTMENISKAGAKTGGLVAQATTTGRSKVDCEMKAREILLKEMEEKLQELNLQD